MRSENNPSYSSGLGSRTSVALVWFSPSPRLGSVPWPTANRVWTFPVTEEEDDGKNKNKTSRDGMT